MFEMLGNWSFGDYFKKEAINWAWEYLVEVLKLNPERLYATVFEGSPAEGLDRDNEAAGYWEQYLPKDHILNGNKHDNFWEMGIRVLAVPVPRSISTFVRTRSVRRLAAPIW